MGKSISTKTFHYLLVANAR